MNTPEEIRAFIKCPVCAVPNLSHKATDCARHPYRPAVLILCDGFGDIAELSRIQGRPDLEFVMCLLASNMDEVWYDQRSFEIDGYGWAAWTHWREKQVNAMDLQDRQLSSSQNQ